jgi:hypothetical protein
MSEEAYWPEADRFKASLNRKIEEAPLPDLPHIPDDATNEERYKILEPLAAEALASIAADPKQPASARVAAAKEINDRAAGKSVAKVEIEQTDSQLKMYLEKAREIRKLQYEPTIDAEYEVVDNSIN